MLKVVRTALADEDLIGIWNYIADDNLEAADRILDRFEAIFLQLAEQPRMGRSREDLAEGLRHFVNGDYLVLYRTTGAAIEIARVVHGARDLTTLFP